MKSCTLKNATEARLNEIITYNLNSLAHIIDYNIKQNIRLFRISSDLIPFASNPANTLPWWDTFSSHFEQIGHSIKNSGMRVSMHPGQYTVLNSPQPEVVERAIKDLEYHCRILNSLGLDEKHKIVLHIGGIYQNKRLAQKRFIRNFSHLDQTLVDRLVVENDDRAYNIEEVLEIGIKLGIPVIIDSLHHEINPSQSSLDQVAWIEQCGKTWREKDGRQKIHYSQQDPLKKPGSHSESIKIHDFMQFHQSLAGQDIDIMLEVKDKNLSAVKCINCLSPDLGKEALELEWNKYKFTVMEFSPSNYEAMCELLRAEGTTNPVDFYRLLEDALAKPRKVENVLKTAGHIWGLLERVASAREKEAFARILHAYGSSQTSIRSLKTYIRKTAVKYQQNGVLNSYYFVF